MTEDRASPAAGAAKAATGTDAELEAVRAEAASLHERLARCDRRADEQARRHELAGEELQHRARNTMALIRSAFKRTAERSGSLEEVEMHFCGRLDVLAHYMLPHSGLPNAMIDVENIIRDELRNFQFGDAPGIMIEGPDTTLSLDQAQPFALAIHELATNALKFGALYAKSAKLNVTWEIDHGYLKLRWEESGVPIVVSAPVAKGFGQEYIEEGLPYQIDAVTRFERQPGGILCSIEIPLAARTG